MNGILVFLVCQAVSRHVCMCGYFPGNGLPVIISAETACREGYGAGTEAACRGLS